MTAQQTVTSTFADENIEVLYSSKGPYADLKERIMYLRPMPDQISQIDVDSVRGDCDHELSHFLYTDLDVMLDIHKYFVKLIFNAVEDGRTERLISDKWYGCAQNIESSEKRALSKVVRDKSSDTDNIRFRALVCIMLITKGWDCGKCIKRLGADLNPLMAKITEEIKLLPSISSCNDSLVLARAIAEKWSEWSVDCETESQYEKYVTGLLSNQRKQIVRTIATSDTKNYVPKVDCDEVVSIKPSNKAKSDSGKFFEGIRKVVPILRRRMIMDHETFNIKDIRHQKKGKLDSRNLHKYKFSNAIFIKRIMRQSINLDFTLLIDCSGSMVASKTDPDDKLDKLTLSSQCAAALSSTLDLIGITNECLGFTTATDRPISPVKGYDRVRPIKNMIIKHARSNYQQCRYNFAEMSVIKELYENIDGESLLWAAQRSMARSSPETRRVIVVFSDGLPQSRPERDSVLRAHLNSVVERIESAGFLLIGVGIESEAVKSFYKNYLVCKDLTTFASVFFEAYRKLLKKVV